MKKKYNCSECNCQISENDVVTIDGIFLCPSCAERLTVFCRDCGTRIWCTETYDGDLCEHCYDNNYTICTGCGRVILYSDTYYTHSDEDKHENCTVKVVTPIVKMMRLSMIIIINRYLYSIA